MYYIIHADANEKVKESLGNDLNNLVAFNVALVGSRQVIAEKAYYYSSVLEELDDMKKFRESETEAD